MKLSVSVPDDLWEAAQLATLISDPKMDKPRDSVVVQRGLQVMVSQAWKYNPDIMQGWLEGKQERIKAGIAKLVRGKPQPKPKKRSASR